jgi:predicted transcriptional regulator
VSDTSDEGRLAAQELVHQLECTPDGVGSQLASPPAFVYKAKDIALREKLRTHPHVTLHGQTTGLTPAMLNSIIELADELRISELDAMALYAEASKSEIRMRLQDLVGKGFVENALTGSIDPLDLGNDVFRAARELYFYERSCALKTVHLLMQSRLEQTPVVVAASDQLLNANLVGNLVGLVREWTRLAEELERELSNASTSTQTAFGLVRPAQTQNPAETRFAKVLLAFAYGERQVASECLFFLTYHTQCTADEVASLIDLVKELTNGSSETTGLPLLNPILNVPSAFHDPAPATVNPWGAPFTSALPPLREKHPVEWEEELVTDVWKQGGKPQLLQCVSSLVLSVVCALDSRHELIDRDTHDINFFGKVSSISLVMYVLVDDSHSCCLSRAMHSFHLKAMRQYS